MLLAAIPPPYEYSPLELTLIWAVYAWPLMLALAFGLIVGSFINVVVWRAPRWRSLMDPGSHCYSCGTLLEGKYNIPLWSWISRRGHCTYCNAPFSIRYFWIELLTGALFVGILFVRFYLPDFPLQGMPMLHVDADAIPYLMKAYLFVTILLIIAAIDAEFRYIFHTFTVPMIVIGLLAAPVTFLEPECINGGMWWLYRDALFGALLGAGLVGGLHAIYPRGMGAGDVMMAGMLGAFLGWEGLLVGLYASLLAGGAMAAVLMVSSIAKGTYKPGTLYIPFGPFLAIGAVVGMLFGCTMFRDYTKSFKTGGSTEASGAMEHAEHSAAE